MSELVQNQPFDEAIEVSSAEGSVAGGDDSDGGLFHPSAKRTSGHGSSSQLNINDSGDLDDSFNNNNNSNNYNDDNDGDHGDDNEEDDISGYGERKEYAGGGASGTRKDIPARPQSRRQARPGSARGLAGRPGQGPPEREAEGNLAAGPMRDGYAPGMMGLGEDSDDSLGAVNRGLGGGDFGGDGDMRAPSPELIPGQGESDDSFDMQQQQQQQQQQQYEQDQQYQQQGMDGGATGDASEDFSGAWDNIPEGGYRAEDYEDLDVSDEVRELFQKITRYQAHDLELDAKLMPFIPDFIPAVGDLDAFIKVERPDMRQDNLGLVALDEPTAQQSNPQVLKMKLGKLSKQVTVEEVDHVSKVDTRSGDGGARQIDDWVRSIEDLHRSNPAPQVTYTRQMPSIENLMQVWPTEFENLLEEIKLPGASLDVTTSEYARIVCALTDVPVQGNVLESLHLLFTLYSEFSQSQHFQQQQQHEHPLQQ